MSDAIDALVKQTEKRQGKSSTPKTGSGYKMDQETYDRYETAYNGWKKTGQYSSDFNSWYDPDERNAWAAIRDMKRNGGKSARIDGTYVAMDKDSYDRYSKEYDSWKKTGMYSDGFESWFNKDDRDTFAALRDYDYEVSNGIRPSESVQALLDTLDEDVLKRVSSDYLASQVYDLTDPEDLERQKQGLPSKASDKYYDLDDELDRYLYRHGIPSNKSNYLSQKYAAAYDDVSAEREYQEQYDAFVREYSTQKATNPEAEDDDILSSMLQSGRYNDVFQNFSPTYDDGTDFENSLAELKQRDPNDFNYSDLQTLILGADPAAEQAAPETAAAPRSQKQATWTPQDQTALDDLQKELEAKEDERTRRSQERAGWLRAADKARADQSDADISVLDQEISALEASISQLEGRKATIENDKKLREMTATAQGSAGFNADGPTRLIENPESGALADADDSVFHEVTEGWHAKGKAIFKGVNGIGDSDFVNTLKMYTVGGEQDYLLDPGYAAYKMTDDEKRVFNYYAQNGGEKKAVEYYNALLPTLNARVSADNYETEVTNVANMAEQNPIIASIAGTVMQPQNALEGYIIGAQALGEYGTPVTQNDPRMKYTRASNYAREEVSEDMTPAGQLFYQTGMSMLDNLARLPMGKAGLVMMAGNVMASRTDELISAGATSDQALAGGFASAAIEVLTEYISLDKVLNPKLAGSAKDMVKQALIQGGIEASEEAASEILNLLFDTANRQDDSEWRTLIAQYMEAGYSQEEAQNAAFWDCAQQVFMSAIGGFMSGGVMGGGTQLVGNVAQGNEFDSSASIGQQLQTGMALSQAYNDAMAQGGKALAADVQRKVAVDLGTIGLDQETAAALTKMTDKIAQVPQAWMSEQGMTAVDKFTQTVMQKSADIRSRGAAFSEAQTKAQTRLNNLYGEISAAQEAANIARANGDVNGYAEAIGGIKTAMQAYQDAVTNTKAELNTKKVKADAADQKDRAAVTDAGKAVKPIVDGEYERVKATVAAESGADYAEAAVERGIDPTDYAMNAANTNYRDGVNRADTKTWTPSKVRKQLRVLDALGKKYGTKIVIEDTITRTGDDGRIYSSSANGFYDPKDGTIHIALDAEEGAYMFFAVHELTHKIQRENPAAYKVLSDFIADRLNSDTVYNGMSFSGNTLDERIQSVVDLYASKGKNLTYDEAFDEIIADAVPVLLSDEATVRDLVRLDRTLAERIHDFFEGFYNSLLEATAKLAYGDANKLEFQALANDRDAVKSIADMFKAALEGANESAGETGASMLSLKQSDIDALLAENDNTSAIESQIKRFETQLSQMEVAARVPLREKNSASNENQSVEFSKRFGGSIDIQGFGKVEFTEKLVRSAFHYLEGQDEQSAMWAVPYVLKRGMVIGAHPNHKLEGFQTITIGAPVEIGDETYNMGVTIRKTKGWRYRMHRVALSPVSEAKTGAEPSVRPSVNGAPATDNTPVSHTIADDGQTGKSFSMKSPVEATKELVAVHNLSEEKLGEALRLGGFPMPSIAITKASIGHENFGDISVVFGKHTISPTDRRNKVYGGDAWTPTRPTIGYKINDKVRESIEGRVKSLLDGTTYASAYRLMLDDDNMNDKIARLDGDYMRAYSDNEALKIAFLMDRGIPFSPVMKEKQYSYYADNVTLGRLNEEIDGGAAAVLNESREIMSYEPLVRKLINDRYEEQGQRRILDKEMSFGRVDGIITAAASYAKAGDAQVVDDSATASRIDAVFDEKVTSEYEAWLEELFKGIIEKRGLRNNKDWYTPSGNRRGFDQLYMEYNLDNIVKAMAQEQQKGGGVLGTGNIFGAATKDYASISEVKGDSNRIVNEDEAEHKEKHDAFLDRMMGITQRMVKPDDGKFGATLDAGDALVDSLLRGKTPKGILRELKEWTRFNATEEIAQEIYDLASDISNEPVSYFEAKPHRAVTLDEIGVVILPDTAEDLRIKLENLGIAIETYKSGDEQDRLAKLNGKKVSGLLFSMKSGRDYRAEYTEEQDLLGRNEPAMHVDAEVALRNAEELERVREENKRLSGMVDALREQFHITKGYKPNEKALNRVARSILRKYGSQYDQKQFADDLRGLFDSIGNEREFDGDTVMAAATSIARKVLNESTERDDSVYETTAHAREYFRRGHFALSETQKQEVAKAYDGVNNFRRRYFGKIGIAKEGTTLDQCWEEICDITGLDPNTNEGDQPAVIAEFLDSAYSRPYVNPFGTMYDMDDAAYDLASEMFDDFFHVPQVQTFADKQRGKLNEANQRYREEMAKMRQDYEDRYNDAIALTQGMREIETRKLASEYEGKLGDQKQQLGQKYRDMVSRKNQQMQNQAAAFSAWKKSDREKRSERESVRKYRGRVEHTAKELRTWLLSPTKEKHVPAILQGTIANLLENIDMEVRGPSIRSESWKESIRGLSDMFKKYRLEDGNGEFSGFYMTLPDGFTDSIDMLAGSVDGVQRFADMDSEQMRTLDYILAVARGAVTSVNKLYSNARYQTVSEIGERTIDGSEARKQKSKTNALDRLLNVDMLDSFSYAREIGDGAVSVVAELEKGAEKSYERIRQGTEFFSDLKKEHGVSVAEINKWTDKKSAVEIWLDSGNTIRMTPAQIMELYALSKRDQAMQHILGGGIKVNTRDRNDQAQLTVYRITESDLSRITDTLTATQRAMIDGMQGFLSKDAAAWGNEVWMQLYMYEMFGEENYWPIKSAPVGTKTEDPDSERAINAMLNIGATKALNAAANNPIMVGDAFDTFTSHVAQMARLNGLAAPIEDAMKWYNYVSRDEDGVRDHNRSTKGAVEKIMGRNGHSYFLQLIKDINGLSSGKTGTEIPSKLISNYKRAAVAGKLRVVIQQPTAIIRATAMVNPKFFSGESNGSIKQNISEMRDHCPLAWWKSQGNYEVGTGRSMRGIIVGSESTLDTIMDTAMRPAGIADDFAWGQLWSAVKREVKAYNKGIDTSSDEYMEKVADRFTDVVNQTQVVDSVMHRSQIMRSKDVLAQMSSSFMAEPTKTYNMLRNAVEDCLQHRPGAKRRMARTATAAFVSIAANAAVKALHDALRDRKEADEFADLYAEKYLSNFMDDANPLNSIPYIKDIWSIANGSDVERMDMSAVSDVFAAFNHVRKYIADDGDSKYTPYKLISDATKSIGSLLGVPVPGLLNTAELIVNTIDPGAIRKYEVIDREQRKKLAESGIDKGDFYGMMGAYDSATNASKAYSILSYDADNDGKADFSDDEVDMIAELLGLSYDSSKDGSLKKWAKKQQDSYLKRKSNELKKGQITQAEYDELEAKYDDFYETAMGLN